MGRARSYPLHPANSRGAEGTAGSDKHPARLQSASCEPTYPADGSNEALCHMIHRRSRCDRAQLLHQAELIDHIPMFGDLSIGHAQNLDEFDRHFLPCRRYPEEFSLVRAIECLAGHHLVAFSNLVVNDRMKIREGLAEHDKELFDALTVRRHSWRSAVVDHTVGQKLVYRVDVALVLDLFNETAGERLVFFR